MRLIKNKLWKNGVKYLQKLKEENPEKLREREYRRRAQ
jgi:hypothetical protein